MTDQPVAGYFRVSMARDDMKAPEIYEEEITRYCSYKGLTLAKLYSDIDQGRPRSFSLRCAANSGGKPDPSWQRTRPRLSNVEAWP